GVVAADFLAAVADGFHLLVGAGIGGGLLGFGSGHGPGGGFLGGGPDRPDRFLEALFLLHSEDRVGHLVVDAVPHGLEFLHALPLVFGFGIDLGIAHQADAGP